MMASIDPSARSDAIASYKKQGAAVVRDVVPEPWIEAVGGAIDRVLVAPTGSGIEYTPSDAPGRYYGDFFLWRHDRAVEAFLRDSPLPALAAEVMGVDEVYLFYDQLLVKEPHTKEPTPLHQDLPYWPIRGEAILSIWVPFDPVTPESGAVRYLEGSHRWDKFYAPASFSEQSEYSAVYEAAGLETMDDPEAIIRGASELYWETAPGDVVLHNALTLHHAPGNGSAERRRRALAVRYVGPEVVYDARPGTFMQNPKLAATLPALDLCDGERLRGELFPQVWPPRG